MLELKKVKLSVFYFLKEHLDADEYGSDGYTNDDLVTLSMYDCVNDDILTVVLPTNATGASNEIVLPVVSLERLDSRGTSLQLGGGYGTVYRFVINIAGDSADMADELSAYLYRLLETYDIDYKDYDMGFPPDVTNQTVLSKLFVNNVREHEINVYGSSNVADKHKRELSFDVLLCNG